jgi:hypothetical protein
MSDDDHQLQQLAALIEEHGAEPPQQAVYAPKGNGVAYTNDLHRTAVITAEAMHAAWLHAAEKTDAAANALFQVQTDLRAKMAAFSKHCREQGPIMAESVQRAVGTAHNIAESMASLTEALDR